MEMNLLVFFRFHGSFYDWPCSRDFETTFDIDRIEMDQEPIHHLRRLNFMKIQLQGTYGDFDRTEMGHVFGGFANRD